MKRILGAAIGNCVHVGGVAHFLLLAEQEGYEAIFLGPAVDISRLFQNIKLYNPDIIAIGYRLTPANAKTLLDDLVSLIRNTKYEDKQWVFGGTKPVAEVARQYGFFSFISDGLDDIDDSIRFLRKKEKTIETAVYENNLIDRVGGKYPYPLLRHHYGRPSYEETLRGIKELSEAKILDIISLGPDQNTQQYFFRPEQMDQKYDGAGGVPIRNAKEFRMLKEASLRGNYPLMRCYSGTSDVIRFAQTLLDTIDNAWCAVPLCWYNELDGRGDRSIEVSIQEAQELMRWHAARSIPVEINEPHHWALRDAHDTMSVIMAFISAYNAKRMGVTHYIAQYMFNVPNTLSFPMDLARVLAMKEMVESLHDSGFTTLRQTRAGLPFLSGDYSVAKGQLAASTYMQLSIQPHIIHVVGYCEADHAATAREVIESCKIVRGVIRSLHPGQIDYANDTAVMKRKNDLLRESSYTLNFIKDMYSQFQDPLANPEVLADCVRRGILDAPHIVKNSKFRGILATKVTDGKCVAYSKQSGGELTEEQRLQQLLTHEDSMQKKSNRN